MGGTSRRPERAPCAHDATPSPSVTNERLRTAQAPPGRLRVPPRPRARPLSSQDSQKLCLALQSSIFVFSGRRKGEEGEREGGERRVPPPIGRMVGTPAPNCTHCDVFEDLSDIHKVSKRPERHERESSTQPLTSARTRIAWAAAMQDIHGTQPAGAVQGCRQGVACCQVMPRVTAAPRTRNLPAHRLQILNAHGGRCRFAASGRSTSSRARWVTPP